MCDICDGKTYDDVFDDIEWDIDHQGYAIQGVEAGPSGWGWVYTIGLIENFGHPELVVASGVPRRAMGIVRWLANEVVSGIRFDRGDDDFRPVHPRQYELGLFNIWSAYYRATGFAPTLRSLQLLLPDDVFCARHAGRQPRLDRADNVLLLPPVSRGQSRGGGAGRRPKARAKAKKAKRKSHNRRRRR